jgi:hypothetical protein
LTAAGLRAVVGSLDQPVYWAGPRPGLHYGLTRNSKGDVFVRYLSAGTPADVQQELLTIGTYRFPRAYAATKALTTRLGAISKTLPDGGLLYYRADHPVSVYLVYPNVNYQIEVFSPDQGRARQLVIAGRVRALG